MEGYPGHQSRLAHDQQGRNGGNWHADVVKGEDRWTYFRGKIENGEPKKMFGNETEGRYPAEYRATQQSFPAIDGRYRHERRSWYVPIYFICTDFFADVLLSMQTYIVGLFCGPSNRRVVVPSLITALGSER